jgi:NADH-quinone oxidoreductase subunit L
MGIGISINAALLIAVEIFSPIIIALLILMVRSRVCAGVLAVIASSASLLSAVLLFANVLEQGAQRVVIVRNWFAIPGVEPIDISFALDSVSTFMSILLCALAIIILVYSIEYMKGEPYDHRRYWFLMLIFIASMLVFINADNFIAAFIGWEGLGLCSFMLIGYYYRDEKRYWIGEPTPQHSPTSCASKVFLVIGSSDVLMLTGVLTLIALTKTPYYEGLKQLASQGLPTWLVLLPLALLLIGALAKSAQFPLHIWLPYAMAGPTPVSALLHSATMVKAGFYLILRLLPFLIDISREVSEVTAIFWAIAIAGAFSIIEGGLSASKAIELKRVLAYSTISQLGYLFLILGVSGFTQSSHATLASLFHMTSHAIFKAALFLVAGILIHMFSTIYINEMNFSIRSRLGALLFLVTLILCLSLVGFPPMIGYWSKKLLCEVLHHMNLYTLLIIAIAGVFLTAYYTTRMMKYIFTPRNIHTTTYKHCKSALEPHENHISKLLLLPIILLATATLFLGIFSYIPEYCATSILKTIFKGVLIEEGIEELPENQLLTGIKLLVVCAGVVLALKVRELRVLSYLSLSNIASIISQRLKQLYAKGSQALIHIIILSRNFTLHISTFIQTTLISTIMVIHRIAKILTQVMSLTVAILTTKMVTKCEKAFDKLTVSEGVIVKARAMLRFLEYLRMDLQHSLLIMIVILLLVLAILIVVAILTII